MITPVVFRELAAVKAGDTFELRGVKRRATADAVVYPTASGCLSVAIPAVEIGPGDATLASDVLEWSRLTAEQSRTYMDGRTFRVGGRVSYRGLPGTVIGFHVDGSVFVEVDDPDALPGSDRYFLNPEAARNAGRPDFNRTRDHGRGAGCFKIMEAA